MGSIREYRDSKSAGKPLNCEEFQSQMSSLMSGDISTGGDIHSHEHLQTCARCTDLLAELETIADAAKSLLLPVHEPGDAVWRKIQASITEPASGSNGHLSK